MYSQHQLAPMHHWIYTKQEASDQRQMHVVRNIITHEDYKSTLLQKASQTHTMMQIRSFGHQLYTVKLNKTSLSPYDDKRYILDNGCDTLAYGHYKTYK